MRTVIVTLLLGLLLVALPAPVDAARDPVALVVLLENQGVKANLPTFRVRGREATVPVARCGNLVFGLNAGESPAQLLTRLGNAAITNRACLDPQSWTVEQITPAKWLEYTSDMLLEELAKAVQMIENTRGLYDQVVVLEDAACQPDTAVATIRRLSPRYILDIHVLTHGGNEFFSGYQQARFDEDSFFSELRQLTRLRLRAVYQMNCVSGTLVDDWRKLGADVVDGTRGTENNYMPHQYFHFLRHWRTGDTFGKSIRDAFAEAAAYTLPAYQAFGVGGYVESSRLLVSGNGNLQATSGPAGSSVVPAPVQEAVEQTIEQLVAAYQAAGKTLAQIAELLKQAGHEVGDIARVLAQEAGASAAAVAQALHDAGCTARQVALALKNELGRSADQVASALKQAGYTAKQTAVALHEELGRTSKQVAKHLVDAGYALTSVVTALRDELECSVNQIASYLQAAGATLAQVATAIWNTTSQKTVAAFNALVGALVAAFEQPVNQVAGTLAQLGISGS